LLFHCTERVSKFRGRATNPTYLLSYLLAVAAVNFIDKKAGVSHVSYSRNCVDRTVAGWVLRLARKQLPYSSASYLCVDFFDHELCRWKKSLDIDQKTSQGSAKAESEGLGLFVADPDKLTIVLFS
jgi:hypothetical protein